MPRTVDYIREDAETITVKDFWRLVDLAIRAGLVDGFTPSPRVQSAAELELADTIAASVHAAIERGREAGV